jgi:DivIVA domain-containing protein
MVLTPADVHNVAFSRPRLGKRGYSEQEVDLFIDLVEQELVRHIAEDAELRNRNAELRNRDGGLLKRQKELAEREATLQQHECDVHEHECELRKHEGQVRQHEVVLAQRQAQLAKQGTPLPQQVAQLRYREAQVAQREAQVAQHDAELAQQEAELAQREDELRQQDAELTQWETELRQQEAELEQREARLAQREAELYAREAELRQRVEQQQAVASCVGAGAVTNRPYRQGQQMKGALSKPAAVNGASGVEETRPVVSVHGRHDMERMAIRAVTDTLGNTVAEAVHERTGRSAIDNGGPDVASEPPTELEQLKAENAELTRSLGLLKSAAAALAAALDRP